MKYLFINSVCGIRSTGRICTDLAQKLEKEGHECKIAYGRVEEVPEEFQKYAVRIGNETDLKLHAIQTRLFDTHGFGSKKATERFLEWADRYNPDVLWLHNLHGYYIHVELLFSWIKSRPQMQVKWTLHDCWAFTGHCSHFTYAKCAQWKTRCEHCVQLRRYPKCYGVGNVGKNYDRKKSAFTGVPNMTLITPSQWLAELVKDSFLCQYPVEVQYNSIDTSVFKPTPSDFRARYGLQGRFIVLGVASTWEERKGLYDFIKLSQLLDDRFSIVLVGVSDRQMRTMPERIIAISRTDNAKELAEIYTAADVFVNPTYEDNYPTVNLEAQACGTQVVAYDAGGTRETLHGEENQLVPAGNVEMLRQIIEACLYARKESHGMQS